MSSFYTSCSKDDDQSKSVNNNTSTNDTGSNTDDSSQDPEGTVIANLTVSNDVKGWYERLTFDHMPDYPYIFMYNNNNFKGGFSGIASVGKVKGLSSIKKIPTTGWAEQVAIMPGYGYVIRAWHDDYIRLYVVQYMENTSGGIMGCTIKYQAPWEPEQ